MPRINTTRSAKFEELRTAGVALGEANDCTVISIAATTGKSYNEVHAALAAAGRKNRKGAFLPQMEQALAALGFRKCVVQRADFLAQYPEPHRSVLKGITTHHPERFNKVWRDGCNYILFTTRCRHAVGVANGNNADWTKGRAQRVAHVWRITPNVV